MRMAMLLLTTIYFNQIMVKTLAEELYVIYISFSINSKMLPKYYALHLNE